MTATSFDFVLLTVCGWVNRRQLAAIAYLRGSAVREIRMLRSMWRGLETELRQAGLRREREIAH